MVELCVVEVEPKVPSITSAAMSDEYIEAHRYCQPTFKNEDSALEVEEIKSLCFSRRLNGMLRT